jgi:hypothetical protein
MPANLTPQYRAAEAGLKVARTVEEKRAALEEMLSTIPKHKGTEKMQADLKRRLARLRQEQETRAGRHAHAIRVEPEGAAQVMLLGPPNSGKSALLAALTRAEPEVADYPFTTTRPQPGMMLFEDVQIQLVDLPPVTREHMDPWLANVVSIRPRGRCRRTSRRCGNGSPPCTSRSSPSCPRTPRSATPRWRR